MTKKIKFTDSACNVESNTYFDPNFDANSDTNCFEVNQEKKFFEENDDEFLKVRVIPCEVYSRVVGYFRPVSAWNLGKQVEFAERKTINLYKFVKRCSS